MFSATCAAFMFDVLWKISRHKDKGSTQATKYMAPLYCHGSLRARQRYSQQQMTYFPFDVHSPSKEYLHRHSPKSGTIPEMLVHK
jgi:hypothetical protein